ncbi:MAG: caspase domain-containing protein, partial [Burkholderiales bacterium]
MATKPGLGLHLALPLPLIPSLPMARDDASPRWCVALNWLCFLLLCLGVLSASQAQAQTPAASTKRIALVIGNAAYVGEKPLRNPVNDAVDVEAAFKASGLRVYRHTDLGRKALNQAVEDFMRQAEDADLAIIYFSGHGMQTSGETFLLPTDAQIQTERDVRSEGLRLGELMDDLQGKRVRHSVLILDACRNNPFSTRTRSTVRGLARPKEMSSAFLVAYATADGTTADDGAGRNGTYTEQLLAQMKGANARRSLRDIVEDTQLAVEAATRGAQSPKTYGDTARFRAVALNPQSNVVPEPVKPPQLPSQTGGLSL